MSEVATVSAAPAAGSVIIVRTPIITTKLVVYSAYMVCADYRASMAAYSTLAEYEGARTGRMGTETLPAELEALPVRSVERWNAVTAWAGANYDRAYALIIDAYPEVAGGTRSMGQITTVEG